uniref:Uncharacterized protein n=1 Tax=Romanomermis culicivorax TaxID=13658 RepID=A0A915KT75_ROMCU
MLDSSANGMLQPLSKSILQAQTICASQTYVREQKEVDASKYSTADGECLITRGVVVVDDGTAFRGRNFLVDAAAAGKHFGCCCVKLGKLLKTPSNSMEKFVAGTMVASLSSHNTETDPGQKLCPKCTEDILESEAELIVTDLNSSDDTDFTDDPSDRIGSHMPNLSLCHAFGDSMGEAKSLRPHNLGNGRVGTIKPLDMELPSL